MAMEVMTRAMTGIMVDAVMKTIVGMVAVMVIERPITPVAAITAEVVVC